jgi:hypothetical protein
MADQPNINQIEHPFVKAKVKTESLKHSICPKKTTMDIKIVYPQETGSAKIDQFFEKYADDFFKNSIKIDGELLDDSDLCGSNFGLYSHVNFESYKPNPNILGILFMKNSYWGGAHDVNEYRSYNFDLTSGKELEITDLFPRPKSSLPKLYSFAYSELCIDSPPKHPAANIVLGGGCGKDKTAPKEFLNLTGPLDNLAHLTLSTRGAHLNMLAIDLWAMFQGPYSLLISKKKLIEMGAKNLWENAPYK